MKTELLRLKGRGLCIVISEIDENNFKKVNRKFLPNPNKIAEEIRNERIIAAIKEFRIQTGWGLKESKEYVDKFVKDEYGRLGQLEAAADRFIAAHLQEFFDDEEFEI